MYIYFHRRTFKQEETRERESERGRKKTMIYRSWSLLTGPPAILAGVIGGLLVSNYFVFPEDPLKPKPRNPASDRSIVQAIGK